MGSWVEGALETLDTRTSTFLGSAFRRFRLPLAPETTTSAQSRRAS